MFILRFGETSWYCKIQPIVSSSTTEAKHQAMTIRTEKRTWLIQLPKDMH